MAPRRPETLEEVKGQASLIQYGRTKINQGIFPQVTLWSGEEGLGKNTIALLFAMAIHCESAYKPCYECETCRAIAQRVIREEKDNEYVKVFNMSIDGGKDAAVEAKDSLNTNFSPNGKRVVIFDECHRMCDAAQDVLNKPLEKLPKGVYAMFLTTDPLQMSKALMSRFVQLHLQRLTRRETIELLRSEANRRKLNVQGGDATLDLIASWAENKPRAALSVLEGMGSNCDIDYGMIKDFLCLVDIKKVIPLISSLNGSILVGMNSILELPMDKNTHTQLVDILVEAVKLKENQMSFKVANDEAKLLKEAVQDIEMPRLVTFLYNVSALPTLTKQGLIAAYLKGHPYVSNVTTHKDEMLQEELAVKAMHQRDTEGIPEKPLISSMTELLNRGTVLGKE